MGAHGIGVGFRFGAGWPPLILQVERPHDRCIRRRESVRRSRCARLRREAGILSELGLAVPQLRAHVDRDVEARLRPCADCLPATARQAEPSLASPVPAATQSRAGVRWAECGTRIQARSCRRPCRSTPRHTCTCSSLCPVRMTPPRIGARNARTGRPHSRIRTRTCTSCRARRR